MATADVMIDGKKQGTWIYDCATSKNDVTLDFAIVSLDLTITTGGQDIAQAVASVAKGAVTLLKLAPETEQTIKDSIDTVSKLAPGAVIHVRGGWLVDKDAPRCVKGPDPVRYLSYKVFYGVAVFGSGKIGPVGLDGAVRVGTEKASDYHRCNCGDEVAMGSSVVGGEALALFEPSTPELVEAAPTPVAVASAPAAIAGDRLSEELYAQIGRLTLENAMLRKAHG